MFKTQQLKKPLTITTSLVAVVALSFQFAPSNTIETRTPVPAPVSENVTAKPSPKPAEPVWPTHTVQHGQTVTEIAEWYGTTPENITTHNNTTVEPGTKLTIVQATTTPTPPTDLTEDPTRTIHAEEITKWAEHYDIDPAVFRSLVWQESRWDNDAVSPVGAFGLAQLMPATAAWAVDIIEAEEGVRLDPRDPSDNLRIGAWYLASLKTDPSTNGDMWRMLVAYNQGPGALAKHGPYNDAIKYANIVLGKSSLFEHGPTETA